MKYLGRILCKKEWFLVYKGKRYDLYECSKKDIEIGIKTKGWTNTCLELGVIIIGTYKGKGMIKTYAHEYFDYDFYGKNHKELIKKAKTIRKLGDRLLKKQ